ncbi:Uncharacterised protein [Mycobacteroides abscessus subsp. massiliense]|nr:Uncharacterised protein [Mycobacteroides abscessus subsp. massiliense]
MPETANPRRVHQTQTAFEYGAGHFDLHPKDLAPLRLWCPFEILPDIGHRNRDDLGLTGKPAAVVLFGRSHHQRRRRLLTVADNGCHRGGFVIAHPSDRHVK